MTPKAPPSLRGLRTFCAAARYESFKAAADALFVSASAVSHTIKNLEESLGVTLFQREARALTLTARGAELYAQIGPLVTSIDTAVEQFRQSPARTSVRVSVQPFFGSEYFVPRLSEFSALHPDIDVIVSASDETSERHPATADLSIRLFRAPPSALESTRLFPLRLVPAGSPEFFERIRVRQSEIVSEFPVIIHDTLPRAWAQWADATGIRLPKGYKTTRLDSMIAVLRAAQRGIGAALVPVPMGDLWFAEGSVVRLFDQDLVADQSYYLVWKSDVAKMPAVSSVRDWILSEYRFEDEKNSSET
ncbi:MAG: LysR substrate-binding domain-containing protein [Pseudomonadota bacterium]